LSELEEERLSLGILVKDFAVEELANVSHADFVALFYHLPRTDLEIPDLDASLEATFGRFVSLFLLLTILLLSLFLLFRLVFLFLLLLLLLLLFLHLLFYHFLLRRRDRNRPHP